MAKAKTPTHPSKSPTKPAAKPTVSPKKKSPRASDIPTLVPVDKELKRAWDKQAAIIATASRADARAWDAKYEAVAAICAHEPPLYLAGGFATYEAFVTEHLKEDTRLVRDWMMVATHASPDEEADYSVTRLALLLSLMRVQSKDGSLPKSIPWKTLTLAVKNEHGKRVKRRAVEMSLDEIRLARRLERSTVAEVHGREAPQVQAVRKEFRSDALRATSVKYTDGKFWFGAVPGYAIKEFARALGAAEWESADDTAPLASTTVKSPKKPKRAKSKNAAIKKAKR
jgi:hypothetical protein